LSQGSGSTRRGGQPRAVDAWPDTERARRIHRSILGRREAFREYAERLVGFESPTDDPASQGPVQDVLEESLLDLGFRVRRLPGRSTGGHLFAVPSERVHGAPAQMIVGHSDTVWPVGTLPRMPIEERDGRLYGPGVLDMKGGLTMMVFALRALRELDLRPELTPVVLVNSDEETGSPESARYVRMLARRVRRAFVLEPAMGPEGRLKTARKGIARFEVAIRGKAAHSGLAPEAGVSAIEELAHVIRALHGMTDVDRGTTVNVGVVRGGVRPNVVAPSASASVDARVTSMEEARALERAVHDLRALTPGAALEIDGGLLVPPLERTPRNRALWGQAQIAAATLDLSLDEASAGGGSDGNTTSRFTATLDGLGCVGDGPHADHEHIDIDASLERCALLACLLMAPAATP